MNRSRDLGNNIPGYRLRVRELVRILAKISVLASTGVHLNAGITLWISYMVYVCPQIISPNDLILSCYTSFQLLHPGSQISWAGQPIQPSDKQFFTQPKHSQLAPAMTGDVSWYTCLLVSRQPTNSQPGNKLRVDNPVFSPTNK